MGYFYGRAKAEKKTLFHILALAAPILAHTIYDMFVISAMACIDGIDISSMSESDIMNMPYYNYLIPLIVCILIVAAVSLVGTIIAFAKIKSKRESAVMQESIE